MKRSERSRAFLKGTIVGPAAGAFVLDLLTSPGTAVCGLYFAPFLLRLVLSAGETRETRVP
jgi:hypothetical protein